MTTDTEVTQASLLKRGWSYSRLAKEWHWHLLLLIGFMAVYWALFDLATQWWLFDKVSTWYLPTGFRLALMLLLPMRFWPVMFYGMYSVYALNSNGADWSDFIPGWAYTVPHALLYSLPMIPLKLWFNRLAQPHLLASLKGVTVALSALLLNQLLNAWQIGTPDSWAMYFLGDASVMEMRVSHFVGGMIGSLFSLPITLMLYYLGRQWWRGQVNYRTLVEILCGLSLILILTLALYLSAPETLYMLRTLVFLPLIFFAYRYSWPGCWAATLAMMALLAASVFGHKASDALIDTQFYMMMLGLSGLLLGAVMAEQRQLALNLQNLASKNQKLAEKVVQVQEAERKALSQELHDEVGQNITALQTELKVLQAKTSGGASEVVKRIEHSAKSIYESVYGLLGWLRPRVLDEFGLHDTLTGRYFRQYLASAGIRYQAQIQCSLAGLDEDREIAIFRIVQEAVTNCVKHAQASEFSLVLTGNGQQLSLSLSDNGVGLAANNTARLNSGFGLTGIQDRLDAIGGKLTLQSSPEQGTRLDIHIPLKEQYHA